MKALLFCTYWTGLGILRLRVRRFDNGEFNASGTFAACAFIADTVPLTFM